MNHFNILEIKATLPSEGLKKILSKLSFVKLTFELILLALIEELGFRYFLRIHKLSIVIGFSFFIFIISSIIFPYYYFFSFFVGSLVGIFLWYKYFFEKDNIYSFKIFIERHYNIYFWVVSFLFGYMHLNNFDINNGAQNYYILLLSPILNFHRMFMGAFFGFVRIRLGVFSSWILHWANNQFFFAISYFVFPDILLYFLK